MSDGQMSAKAVLRKKLNGIINLLSKDEVLRQSEIVTAKVLQNEQFKRSKVVSIYLSMDKEVQTESLLREIFKQGKECFIPRFKAGCPIMEMIRLSSLEEYNALPRNKWNIKQPPDEQTIESVFERGELDLVITPGLAFTSTGLRLGRGKGYYDRFFQRCNTDLPRYPYTIGLAFDEQILPEIPTEAHDFSLDLIIAPQQK